MKLNPEQQLAADHMEGPCIVTAVPGSGKTRTLIARVINLIEKGVSPSNLLCLTFTNKAANQMRDRVTQQVGDTSNLIWISTFHSLFVAVLRKYGHLVGLQKGFSIYDDKDQKELMAKIARMHELEKVTAPKISKLQEVANAHREDIELLEDAISRHKLNDSDREVVQEYLVLLGEFNAVDFSGILHKTHELLMGHEKVASLLSQKFKYILGDEWQDTNRIQYESVKKLASHGNLFVVADKNQSVFAWRGAKPENLDFMKKDFENVKEITLLRNYRSTQEITSAAQRLIRHNPGANDVELISVKGKGNCPIRVNEFPLPDEEAANVVSRIRQLHHNRSHPWNDFAILYRVNQFSKLPEIMLRQNGVPYRIVGGFSFFDRMEVRTTLSYLSVLANPFDTPKFARAIQTPTRRIGISLVGRLERICQSEKISILEASKRVDQMGNVAKVAKENLNTFVVLAEKYREQEKNGKAIGEVASGFIKEAGYYDYMKEISKQDPDYQKRVANIDELLLSVSDFEIQQPDGKLSDYLHSIELMTTEKEKDEDDAVTLLTMHRAKGLEYPVVFIIGAENGTVPHKMNHNYAEERRLMYVAVTRAQERLFISHCHSRKKFDFRNKRERLVACDPSPFIEEMESGCDV